MMNKKLLNLLQKLETKRTDGFFWGRENDSTIWISTVGYKMQSHMNAEEKLLKTKAARYDFKRIQKFDRMSGRTTTFFVELKEGA